jgi:hypothetical protein
MKNKFKKLVAILIALQILLAPVALSTAFAKPIHTDGVSSEEPASAEEPASDGSTPSNPPAGDLDHLKDLTFPVTEILTVGKDEQAHEYFSPTEEDKAGLTKFPVIKFLVNVIDMLTKIAATITVIMLILTGFVMLFSQGSQTAIEKAKQMFLYEVIGLAVIFLSYVIITIVQSVFTI